MTAEIYYQVTGNTENRLPPVVLIHGAGGNHLYWPAEIRRLPGCNVYALDLPGHGWSNGEFQTSVKAYSEIISLWHRQQKLDPAIYVGHSLGSAIAMQLELSAPDQVAGLVLIGSTARFEVNPALLERIADPATFPKAIDMLIHWSFSQHSPDRLKELATMRMSKTPPEVFFADFLACQNFDIAANLPEIRCPAYVISGADDRMTPPGQAKNLATHLPNARFEIPPEAGHMVMLEQPRLVAERLVDFLSALPG